jgi:hypothetical protein
MKTRVFTVFFLIGLLLSSSGCILAPAIDSISKVGIRAADRENLFQKEFQKFHEARYWSDPLTATAFCVEAERVNCGNNFRKSAKNERVIESNIDSVEFVDESYTAIVEVRVKAYEIPYYVVKERIEKQRWTFTLTNGWKLEKYENVKA